MTEDQEMEREPQQTLLQLSEEAERAWLWQEHVVLCRRLRDMERVAEDRRERLSVWIRHVNIANRTCIITCISHIVMAATVVGLAVAVLRALL